LEKGHLVLDGQTAWAQADWPSALTSPLTEKTLSVWIELGPLDQRGGGVMTVQTGDGHAFDAIVFGLRHGTTAQPGRLWAGRLDRAELTAQALYERPAALEQKVWAVKSGDLSATHLLDRGSALKPKEPVAPAGLTCVMQPPPAFDLPATATEPERRRALAAWLTHQDHPLLARVMVNRVWQQHFGRGLVATPSGPRQLSCGVIYLIYLNKS
jgi:hypothetical protein